MNKCMFIGRLGQDGQLKNLPSGMTIYENSLATTEKWKDKAGNPREKTEWINFKIFGKAAEVFDKYTDKGSQVFLEGSWQTETWEKDGKKNYATKLNAKEFRFLGQANGAGKTNENSTFASDDVGF